MKSSIEYVNPPGAGPAQGLYSNVTVVPSGPIACIAGQLSIDAAGNVVGKHDFEAQMCQVFANMGAVLKGMGLEFNHVIKFRTYLVHAQHIELFMKVRASLFPTLFSGTKYPPNTLLVVNRLVKEDFLFELEADAICTPSAKMIQSP
jgi:enamine deaminase RidA (YjgF/YER057c/UK114 family)